MDDYSVFVDNVDIGTITTSDVIQDTISTIKIASGLPYGTHTVKIERDVVVNSRLGIQDFIVYSPSKPSIPANAVELGSYYLMADFVANTTANPLSLSQGVLRKDCQREIVYNGTFSGPAIDVGSRIGGSLIFSSTSGDSISYTFFGTGIEYRWQGATNRSPNISVTLNGTALTTANFPTAVFSTYGSGIAYNSSTGVLDTEGTDAGSGFIASNLPLGVYTIELTNNIASDLLDINVFDVITPVHVPQADRNLLAPLQTVGSNSIRSEIPLANYKQEKQHFVGGVDLGPNKVQWQTKPLTATVTSNGLIDEMTFNNLEVGKTYRLSYTFSGIVDAADANIDMRVENGATTIAFTNFSSIGGSDSRFSHTDSFPFTAIATTITFDIVSLGAGSSIQSSATNRRTFATLEELPNHVETNKF
jgi:hypothetical protein